MTTKNDITELTGGEYWIGDLCYVMHDLWAEFCEISIIGHDVKNGEFELRGEKFWAHGTAYGDGSYNAHSSIPTENVRHFPDVFWVDSGLIGIIPTSFLDERHEAYAEHLGARVMFKGGVTCQYIDGTFIFTGGDGVIAIGTNDDAEEEGEDYDDEGEE